MLHPRSSTLLGGQGSNRTNELLAAPIGFYFAKLWYFEKLYPLAWTMAALRRLAEVE
ncbi:MAG: hypothetical protein R3F11_14050 [Verrucomicrobiales bacterium]